MVFIIGLLVVMLVPAYSFVRGRMARSLCASNLRNLYVGANAYVQEQGQWPQIPTKNLAGEAYAKGWIEALRRYSIHEENWVCPSVEREFAKRDGGFRKKPRVDYFATPFDANPRSPYKWTTQPWFAERGDVHGDGNLMIFASGEVLSLHQVYKDARFKMGR